MNQLRRTLLKSAGTAGVLTVAVATGLLKPGQVLAAEWNKAAFDAKALNDVYKAVGMGSPADSKDIFIKAQDIAENGAVVPVEVTSKIAGTESIAIVVDKNPSPLNSTFTFSNGAEGYAHVRIKMGQSSSVRAVVKAGGKSFIASKEVKVTIGGCGG